MILEFPAAIHKLLDEAMPSDFKLWWVRGVVLDVQEVVRPTGDEKLQHLRDLVLKVGDVDNANDGYEVRIEGNHHSVEINDAVSLLGHERKNVERVSYPRLFINHNTQEFVRAYPDASSLRFGVVPAIEYKHWLAAWRPKAAGGGCVFYGGLLVVLGVANYLNNNGLLLMGGAALVGVLFLLAPAIFTLLLSRWIVNVFYGQPRFSFEPKYAPLLVAHNYRYWKDFTREDLTPLYERLGHLVDVEVQANPAPELEFVPVHRGAHTVGLLTQPKPKKKRKQPKTPEAGATPAPLSASASAEAETVEAEETPDVSGAPVPVT